MINIRFKNLVQNLDTQKITNIGTIPAHL